MLLFQCTYRSTAISGKARKNMIFHTLFNVYENAIFLTFWAFMFEIRRILVLTGIECFYGPGLQIIKPFW